ncbi:WD repeat-containing protein 73 [Brienomyrus brachyistius]|uniref:WD repeat-containing protein 73 n=1 Tax=Brienomyrus brachyistius TaxID=42636 RepID=UPI0020B41DE7|nr:WD repeat-containing protein 73 [Brienomyrus brachyistius]
MEEVGVDDWLIDSLQLYSDLHVFELQDPTQVIEWTSDKSICVAGYKGTQSHEILELLLPQKLSTKDNQGLCPERDFKVHHGGFSEEPISCLKYILGSRCVVTSGFPGSSLQIWQIGGDDTDAIKRTGCINHNNKSEKSCKLASGVSGVAPRVLHGSQIRDVQLTDLQSGRSLYTAGEDLPDIVSSLRFVDADVFLVCTGSGDLWVGDIRDASAFRRNPVGEPDGSYWCMDLRKDTLPSDPAACTVARLSSASRAIVSDLRNLKSPICRAQLNIPHGDAGCDFLSVTWAPALDNCLAVSGFGGMVHIYDITAWRPELTEPQSLFVHKGHIISAGPENDFSPTIVTTHSWHPWRPRTLLSAGTDGSLHVWDWVDKTLNSC